MKNNLFLEIVRTWNINPTPEYRGFRCANCQKYMHKAWHHWVNEAEFLNPVHFCTSCEEKFRQERLVVTKPRVKPDTARFGKYHQSLKETFKQLYSKWKLDGKTEYKIFTCDVCRKNHFKMYHIWERANGTFIELHYCIKCWRKNERISLD